MPVNHVIDEIVGGVCGDETDNERDGPVEMEESIGYRDQNADQRRNGCHDKNRCPDQHEPAGDGGELPELVLRQARNCGDGLT